jgi:TrmH family RNA methyltransferase
MRRIESRHNERLREVARLIASSRDRRKSGRCVLEGAHLVDVYVDRVGPPETLVVLDDARERVDVQALLHRVPANRTFVVTRAPFAELATSPADVGVLAVVTTPKFAASPSARFCLLIDDVQDPGNVGSIIRTAAAAGIEQVLLSSRSAFAWAPKVLRAAQGAHFLTNVIEDVDLVGWATSFRAARGRVFATVVDGTRSLYVADFRGGVAVVIGSEGQGVAKALREKADESVTIPMATGTESLNAAAATAVVLFEAVRQRRRNADPSPTAGP